MPTLHLIGNAHLDPVWLWRRQEGFAEIKATFQSAVDRMNETDEFVFTCAAAAYYRWVEENCPPLFDEIRRQVAEGRWVIVGGWWVQPDCNIPNGESYARHALYSQRYFRSRFGRIARVGYNVDSFGHNGMLPQILAQSGLEAYVFMRPGEHEKHLPAHLFLWESPDGTRIPAYRIPLGYGSDARGEHDPVEGKIRRGAALAGEAGGPLMIFYGVGNHGGGPTRDHVSAVQRMAGELGRRTVGFSSPDAYFAEVAAFEGTLPVVRDDLQHHAGGCYSAHAETKRHNRRAEHRLAAAEALATLAHMRLGAPYPGDAIREAWQAVLFNQFHDILGGCSIREAYDDAREAYGAALYGAATIANAAFQRLSWAVDTTGHGATAAGKTEHWKLWDDGVRGTPVVVCNPHSWDLEVAVQLNADLTAVTDAHGAAVTHQRVRGSQTNGADKWDTLFEAQVPALGYALYWAHVSRETVPPELSGSLQSGDHVLENDHLRLEIDPAGGWIARLYDKDNRAEVFAAPAAVPIVIDERHCDTWAHGVFAFRDEAGRFGGARLSVIETGPLRARLRAESRYESSTLVQEFLLYRNRREVEVRVTVDWREHHAMLKLAFPVNIAGPTATSEIPFGFMPRPANGNEQPGQRWVCLHGPAADQPGLEYGLTVANATSYSYDVQDAELRMTLLRSPVFADHYGQDHRDELCRYMDQGEHDLAYTLSPFAGPPDFAAATRRATILNEPPSPLVETYHAGPLGPSLRGIQVEPDSVVVSACKRAEDDSGYVVRCYEAAGRRVEARIALPVIGRSATVSLRALEIATIIVPDDPARPVTVTDLIEGAHEPDTKSRGGETHG
jgi:alpha-mannosidase